MKKLLAMLTMMCILMLTLVTPVLAATVLQDEQPPKLLTENISLVMTDVHDRSTVENEQVKTRLMGAYKTVLDTVYHSDLLMAHNMNAHNLVLYELFDVDFTDEGESRVLTLHVQNLSAPLITLFTEDGANWIVLPTVNNGNVFTVELPGSGTLALMCDIHAYLGLGDEENQQAEDTAVEDNDAMSSNFTPSVSGKLAPEVVPVATTDGKTIWGYVCNADGEVVSEISDRNYVLTHSVAERDFVLDIETHEYLESAYDAILHAEDVGDLLAEGVEGATIADALDAFMQSQGYDLVHGELVVKDLFEVSVYGDYLKDVNHDDYYLEMTFDADLDPEKPVVVLHSEDGETWHIHENVIHNEDGTLTMKMHDLGVVAFLVEREYSVDVQDAVQAP